MYLGLKRRRVSSPSCYCCYCHLIVVGHVEVVWRLELKLEVINVSNEKEVAVKKELTIGWWVLGWWLNHWM